MNHHSPDNLPMNLPSPAAFLLLILCCLFLVSCSDQGMADLENFVQETKARPNLEVEALPEFTYYPPFYYDGQGKEDPFRAIGDGTEQTISVKGQDVECTIEPNTNRILTAIEKVPLDSLLMVGTLQDDIGNLWGLILAPDPDSRNNVQLMHSVKVGDFVGNSYGRVINVDDTNIEVQYLQSDGKGCWEEKRTSIKLPKPK